MPRRRTILSLFILLGIVSGIILFLRHLQNQPPPWFNPPNPADPAVVELAETVEYRLLEELQKIRPPGEPWSLRIREPQINAWLAARLPDWIAHESDLDWPAELETIQIHLESEGLTLAAALPDDSVYSVRLLPVIERQQLSWTVNRAAVGSLAIKGDPLKFITRRLLPHLNGLLNSSTRDLLQNSSGTLPATHTLEDRRRVILQNLTLRAGALDLTASTNLPIK